MMARELLIKFQMSPNHPMVQLNKAYQEVLSGQLDSGYSAITVHISS